jgi:hypothetical protein
MTRILAFLVACFCIVSGQAWAQGQNPVYKSFASLPTNAALKAYSVSRAVNGKTVMARSGFYAAGDGGGAMYLYSSTACSGGGNNGTQVAPTSGGGCWNIISDAGACRNIKLFGGSGDGVTDNSAAAAAVLAASPSGHACLFIPAGVYAFSSQLVYDLAGNDQTVTIKGDGPETSIMYWPNGGGIKITGSANRTAPFIQDVAVLTGAINTGTGIDLDWGHQHNDGTAAPRIENVRVSGSTIQTNYWATGIRTNGLSNVNFYGVNVWGDTNGGLSTSNASCIKLEAPSDNLAFIFNFASSNVFGCLYGLVYGPNVQGVSISGMNFTLNWNGIYVPSSALNLSQLSIVNSQFDNKGDSIYVSASTFVPQVLISNNVFFLYPSTAGFKSVGGLFWAQFHNNQFISTTNSNMASMGIDIESGSGQNIIADTVCVEIAQCVVLGSSATGWAVYNTRISTSVDTDVAVTNAGHDATNFITGFIKAKDLAIQYPLVLVVTNAASSGGLVRLTVGSTAGLVNGEIVMVNVPGLASMPGLFAIDVINSTTVDLRSSIFSGSFTSNGTLSVLP